MFSVHCEHLGEEVLVTTSDIRSIRNTDAGILVEYRCWCGRTGVLQTGAGILERSRHVGGTAQPLPV